MALAGDARDGRLVLPDGADGRLLPLPQGIERFLDAAEMAERLHLDIGIQPEHPQVLFHDGAGLGHGTRLLPP